MSNRLVMIQPAPGPDQSQSLPVYVDQTGAIAQQAFWQGNPSAVLGFADRFDHGPVTVPFKEFWADPQRAVGKYMVLVDDEENVSANIAVIESVSEIVPGTGPERDAAARPEDEEPTAGEA